MLNIFMFLSAVRHVAAVVLFFKHIWSGDRVALPWRCGENLKARTFWVLMRPITNCVCVQASLISAHITRLWWRTSEWRDILNTDTALDPRLLLVTCLLWLQWRGYSDHWEGRRMAWCFSCIHCLVKIFIHWAVLHFVKLQPWTSNGLTRA